MRRHRLGGDELAEEKALDRPKEVGCAQIHQRNPLDVRDAHRIHRDADAAFGACHCLGVRRYVVVVEYVKLRRPCFSTYGADFTGYGFNARTGATDKMDDRPLTGECSRD
jgi:hypothetical protein